MDESAMATGICTWRSQVMLELLKLDINHVVTCAISKLPCKKLCSVHWFIQQNLRVTNLLGNRALIALKYSYLFTMNLQALYEAMKA